MVWEPDPILSGYYGLGSRLGSKIEPILFGTERLFFRQTLEIRYIIPKSQRFGASIYVPGTKSGSFDYSNCCANQCFESGFINYGTYLPVSLKLVLVQI